LSYEFLYFYSVLKWLAIAIWMPSPIIQKAKQSFAELTPRD
jgi:hypothetical protein